MRFERSAGILLHPTSLPGKYGIGEMGPDAYRFVDLLESAGQKFWQVLPLGPTGYGDSPYQCFSAFAGNHNLISTEALLEEGLLVPEDASALPVHDPRAVDYGSLIPSKMALLRKAFSRHAAAPNAALSQELAHFERSNRDWLVSYALFMALKERNGGSSWSEWEEGSRLRRPSVLASARKELADEIALHTFLQFLFFRQWKHLKDYANGHGIRIIGDLPIFIAYDSADAWAERDLFTIDPAGRLLAVAGVPPDYFSATGQRWGNPLYRWSAMADGDFHWWRKRIGRLLGLVDVIRVDHFRGFDAAWEIPASAPTAETGKWVKGPGRKFFRTLEAHLGELPIIAEDLGVITSSVVELRTAFGFPGMKILQFAFGPDMERKFLPHNYERNCVVYTGSHDNDTTRGFFEKAKREASPVYASARRYLGSVGGDLRFDLIRAAYSSVADLVIVPMQDILNLGSEARMNFPGTQGGNWKWRFAWEDLPEGTAPAYKELTELYDRPPAAARSAT